MNKQSAIFVDAGFLHSVGAQRTAATSYRHAVKLQYSTLIRGITHTTRAHSGVENLRTYWYDASRDGLLTDEHKRIAMIPGVKVRLGRVNYYGEQKGVDLRLALDLVGLARTGAASVAYLISGDDDLTEAVEEAQSLGMRVVLLGIDDKSSRIGLASVADNLAFAVDAIERLSDDLLATAFTKTVGVTSSAAEAGEPGAMSRGKDHAQVENSTGEAGGTTHTALLNAEHDTARAGVRAVGHEEEHTAVKPSGGPPSPALLAARLAAPVPAHKRPQPAGGATPDVVTTHSPATIVYSSSTTGEGDGDNAHHHSLLITAEEVGAKVARNWYANTTQGELAEVFGDRPQLPAFIDAVLLKDCAAAIGVEDTNLQSVRRTLRGSFWDEIDRIH